MRSRAVVARAVTLALAAGVSLVPAIMVPPLPASALGTVVQQAYAKASNTEFSGQFGWATAVSGNTMVIGAVNDASSATGVNGNESDGSAISSGAAYVFTRSGGTWVQQAYLKASNTGAGDNFGFSVAVSGDTIVVGAAFEDSTATGVDGNGADNSASGSGAAYVFARSGSTWTQQAYLKASSTGAADQFGSSVAVSGDTIVVGAPSEGSNATGVNGDASNNAAESSGAAYVFTRSGGTWAQQAYLKASNTGPGDLNVPGIPGYSGDLFGNSVAISGDTVVVGANGEDSNGTGVDGDQSNNLAPDSGAAYVFARSGSTWAQQAYLKASNAGTDDFFGRSVAASGDTVVVGADGEDSNGTGVDGDGADNSASVSGAAYVFARSGGTWTQQAYLKASNAGPADHFGYSVAASGDKISVGAPGEASNATGVDGDGADNSAAGSGAAYEFARSGGTWAQQAYLKASNAEAEDNFGWATAVWGDTIVVGASCEDSIATGVDGDGTDNSSFCAGAAYVFSPDDTIAPSVTIDQAAGQADPSASGPVKFAVHFSEVVAGFTATDVSLSGTAGATTAVVTDDPSGTTGRDFVVSVTGMTGDGTVVASIAAGAAKDAAGNDSGASTSTDNTVTYDATRPHVTINQASGQKDPANSSPVKFSVRFSENVTGFSAGDVTLQGSAKPKYVKVTGSGKTYAVAVSGMTGDGSVVAKVKAEAAVDAAGNTSTASTSTDNTVRFHKPIAGLKAKTLSQTLNQKTVQRDHKITATVKGLAPKEWFYFYFDGKQFKSGKADKNGKAVAQYEVPKTTKLGKHTIRVNGQTTNRTNIDAFTVVR